MVQKSEDVSLINLMQKDDAFALLCRILNAIKTRPDIDHDELSLFVIDLLASQSLVPVSIFSGSLSPAEALCLYLKTEKMFSLSKIAMLLQKDQRTVWNNVHRAVMKRSKLTTKASIMVPLNIFQNHNRSVFENLVVHLKNQGWSYQKISTILKKGYTTVTTVYYRGKDKK